MKKALRPSAKREAASFLAQEGLSILASCRRVGLSRSNWQRVPDACTVRDAEIMAALVDGRPNRGLWKCRNLLHRQGKPWNHKCIYRVYCQMKLNHRRQALHIVIDTSITSMRLLRIFERLQGEHGLPQVLRTDNGPEFLGEAFTS